MVGRESKKKKGGAGSRKEKESCGGLGGEEDGGTGRRGKTKNMGGRLLLKKDGLGLFCIFF